MRIFLSYCWQNKLLADRIDIDFQAVGINLVRDVRNLAYKSDIKDFMRTIRHADFALLLISEDYLKSKNCMYELLELFKDEDARRKMLPILDPNLDCFSFDGKLSFVNYWNNEANSIRIKIEQADPIKVLPFWEELKMVEKISFDVGPVINEISSIKCITYDEVIATNYVDVFSIIGFNSASIEPQLLELRNIKDVNEKDARLQELLIKYPNNKDVKHFQANLELKEKKNFKKAIVLWESILNSGDDSTDTYNYLGESYLKDGEEKLAIHCFEKAIDKSITWFQSYVNLGIGYCQLEDYEPAKRAFHKALEFNPLCAHAYVQLGRIAIFLKNEDDAINYSKKAIELDCSLEQAYSNLMYAYVTFKNDIASAEEHILKAVETRPSPVTYYNYALFCQREQDNIHRAKQFYKKAISVDPNYVDAKLNLSSLEMKYYMNRERAVELLEEVLSYEPENIDAIFNMAILLGTIPSEFERAKSYYDKATQLDSKLDIPELRALLKF